MSEERSAKWWAEKCEQLREAGRTEEELRDAGYLALAGGGRAHKSSAGTHAAPKRRAPAKKRAAPTAQKKRGGKHTAGGTSLLGSGED